MYYSQVGQDKFLNETIFKNKKHGKFLDIGAHDGVTFSNTCFFEKELEWSGICVEPNPTIFDKLIKNRSCICMNNCVSMSDLELDFTVISGYSEMLSGITENYDPRHIARIRREVMAHGGNIQSIKIKSETITSLCDKNNIHEFDFCTIDVEGSELSIVKSIDFSKVNIKYFIVENNYGTTDVQQFLEANGHKKIASVDSDDVYERQA
jgi:FkbM family methyltransferase